MRATQEYAHNGYEELELQGSWCWKSARLSKSKDSHMPIPWANDQGALGFTKQRNENMDCRDDGLICS
jgi:hypothetical protein